MSTVAFLAAISAWVANFFSVVHRFACRRPLNPSEFSVSSVAQGPPISNLVSGHEPDASDPYQVLASASLGPVGVHIGTVRAL